MTPVQKRALLAILTMIESGIQQLRGLIVAGAGEGDQLMPPAVPQPLADHLSDYEEDQLEKMMEAERKSFEAEEQRLADAWEQL